MRVIFHSLSKKGKKTPSRHRSVHFKREREKERKMEAREGTSVTMRERKQNGRRKREFIKQTLQCRKKRDEKKKKRYDCLKMR